jgi:hypothetical protein
MFVMVKCGVLFEVRTDFLSIIKTSFGFKRLTQAFLALENAANKMGLRVNHEKPKYMLY